MSEGGQQRAFANRIKLQSAQEIRQSATATVKAATEKVHKIARSTVQPITLAVVRVSYLLIQRFPYRAWYLSTTNGNVSGRYDFVYAMCVQFAWCACMQAGK